ncbi:hypothetical protein TanjilG_03618 [Lupinus angustifolius]|uniref:Single-stranded DNA binding protein Ssb-like OB fold domain-containing protein n=1 Tax=Lupinus angustifolius TaxID=3871 RepID=A0A4P1RW57_LUPAN|nr:hypothetical protein TanjilG_03618 [Lupinus angustifolius]
MAALPTTTATTSVKRKPMFIKLEWQKTNTNGLNLTVKVLSCEQIKSVPNKGNGSSSLIARPSCIAECLIDDETGSALFTACNEQVDLMNPGSTLILQNANIVMFNGSIRLAGDKWEHIEVTDPASFEVKEDNNFSLVEYEMEIGGVLFVFGSRFGYILLDEELDSQKTTKEEDTKIKDKLEIRAKM